MERASGGGATGESSPASWTADCTAAVESGERLRLEVYTRSAEPAFGTREYYRRVTDRVRELEREGALEECVFDCWGDRLRIGGDSTAVDRHAEELAELRIWAREHGVTLPFEVRECRSAILDEEYAVLVPPHVLVAVYCEDDLVGVVPCREGDRSTSVMELLTLLCEPDRWDDHRTSVTS